MSEWKKEILITKGRAGMGMDLKAVKSLLEDNARRTWNPLGIRESYCGQWAQGLNLPAKGENLLYTGCLYQMIPYIEMFSGMLKRLESLGPTVFRLAMGANKLFNSLGISTTSLLGITISRAERERYFSILRTIASALRRAGVEFAYMREEPYNGVLYHDLGMDEVFGRHVRRLADRIRETGAKRIITVDPHTTYMLRYLMGEFVEGFDAEVIHYMDLLLERGYEPSGKGPKSVAIHDPCYLARWNGLIDQPRELLSRAGVQVLEPEFSRKFTGCCGGPIESLLPSLASTIALKRLKELKETGSSDVVVMCPICLTNFSREARQVGVRVHDITEVIG